MSPISSDDLHRIFKKLDKSNEGRVSTHELHHLLDIVGIHATLEELDKYVGRESLTYIDFLFFYEAMVKSKLEEQNDGRRSPDDEGHVENDISKAFKVFDLNGDGYISPEELKSVLSRLGLLDKSNGRHDCTDMIGAYDENSDGVLDIYEFKNMMSVTSPAPAPPPDQPRDV